MSRAQSVPRPPSPLRSKPELQSSPHPCLTVSHTYKNHVLVGGGLELGVERSVP